jgi:hypothetical protein
MLRLRGTPDIFECQSLDPSPIDAVSRHQGQYLFSELELLSCQLLDPMRSLPCDLHSIRLELADLADLCFHPSNAVFLLLLLVILEPQLVPVASSSTAGSSSPIICS